MLSAARMVRTAVQFNHSGHAIGREERIAQDYDGISAVFARTEISGVGCGELQWVLTKGVPG